MALITIADVKHYPLICKSDIVRTTRGMPCLFHVLIEHVWTWRSLQITDKSMSRKEWSAFSLRRDWLGRLVRLTQHLLPPEKRRRNQIVRTTPVSFPVMLYLNHCMKPDSCITKNMRVDLFMKQSRWAPYIARTSGKDGEAGSSECSLTKSGGHEKHYAA